MRGGRNREFSAVANRNTATRLHFRYGTGEYVTSGNPGSAAKNADAGSLHGLTLQASLTVKDIQKSLSWYVDVLGFTVSQRHEREGVLRAISLRAGDVQLLIALDDGARGLDRVKGEGFSLQLTTDTAVDDVAARSHQAGARPRPGRPLRGGGRRKAAGRRASETARRGRASPPATQTG